MRVGDTSATVTVKVLKTSSRHKVIVIAVAMTLTLMAVVAGVVLFLVRTLKIISDIFGQISCICVFMMSRSFTFSDHLSSIDARTLILKHDHLQS